LTDKRHYAVEAVADGEMAWQLIESSVYGSRTTIIEHLWALEEPPMEDTVKVHLKA